MIVENIIFIKDKKSISIFVSKQIKIKGNGYHSNGKDTMKSLFDENMFM